MHNLPFETAGLFAEDVQTLEKTYTALKEKFNVGLPCDVELPLEKFDLFNGNPNIVAGGTLSIAHPSNNCYLAFIRIHICYNPIKSAGEPVDYYKYQVWGLIKAKKDYGRIFIRRETFADKLVGLVHPVELEFKDDKAFSKQYYVLTNDQDRAQMAMNWNFRNAIMNIQGRDIIIETANNLMVIGDNKYLDAGETIYLTETMVKLASVS